MRKILFLLAAGALAFTSCLKMDGEDYLKKAKPVLPGTFIRDAAADQNQLAMQPADIGLRLAMLKAEADKQGVADLNDVQVNSQSLKNILFGNPTTVVKQEDDSYKITYSYSKGTNDIYTRRGTFIVQTNGVSLAQTDLTKKWTVTFENDVIFDYERWEGQNVKYSGGVTNLYFNGTTGYMIELSGIQLYALENIKSYWSGLFEWKPAEGTDISYSAVSGKRYLIDGEASGRSIKIFNNSTGAEMRYRVEGGVYRSFRPLIEGTETCSLENYSDYDPTYYLSPVVTYEWSLKENNVLSYTVKWNGNEVTF